MSYRQLASWLGVALFLGLLPIACVTKGDTTINANRPAEVAGANSDGTTSVGETTNGGSSNTQGSTGGLESPGSSTSESSGGASSLGSSAIDTGISTGGANPGGGTTAATVSTGGASLAGSSATLIGGTSSSTGGSVSKASCVKAARYHYIVRTDGRLLTESTDASSETFVGDASGIPLANVADATGGAAHGCALLADHTVWCWREIAQNGNAQGQLGNGKVDTDSGAATNRASQVMVDAATPLSGVTQLVRGDNSHNMTCAVTSGGNLYCWGDLTWLSNAGAFVASPYAVAITKEGLNPLANVLQASISPWMACAIVQGDASRELYCWGANDYKNLGLGTTTRQQYPTKVTSLVSPSYVAVIQGGYALSYGGTACAVDEGALKCWGYNAAGETGTGVAGNAVPNPTPVVVDAAGTISLPPPVELAGTLGTMCALGTDTKVWCWGVGFKPYATSYGLTNVASLGWVFRYASNSIFPIFATSDGVYHWGMTARSPKCTGP